jgi:crossover junction endodeoxyribonuclease RuvC
MTRVVGLDLSLTAPGITAIGDAGDLSVRVFKTAKLTGHQRIEYLRGIVGGYTMRDTTDLVAIEGPAYNQGSMAGHHELAGLWWLITHQLYLDSTPYVVIGPGVLKKYATGKGNAGKHAVVAHVNDRYRHVLGELVTDDNQADSLVLAAIAHRHLGYPLEKSLPATHLAALDKVRWPEMENTNA